MNNNINITKTPWIALLAIAAIVFLVSLPGCGANADAQENGVEGDTSESTAEATESSVAEGEANEDADEEEAVPVEVAVLQNGEIESVLSYSANLEAESHVEVHAQASRLVVDLLVEEGDSVRKNQLLARLEDDAQRSELAKVTVELDKAKREYERQKRLHAENLISEQEFNDATYDIEQLRIRKSDAERELSYTEVRAPIQGTVTRRMIKLGDPIQTGQHLFDIVDFESIVARVYVPEKHLRDLAPGILARISAPSLGRGDYVAQVDRIAPVVDPKSGTVKVTVSVGSQPGLRPGLYVDVDLVTAIHADALLVPKRALVYDDDQMFVFRLGEDSRAERVSIRPRLSDRKFIEPDGGLQPGDRIVVAGQTGLKPGALLDPGDDDTEPNDSEPADATASAADSSVDDDRSAT